MAGGRIGIYPRATPSQQPKRMLLEGRRPHKKGMLPRHRRLFFLLRTSARDPMIRLRAPHNCVCGSCNMGLSPV